jgi:hypothetical protein
LWVILENIISVAGLCFLDGEYTFKPNRNSDDMDSRIKDLLKLCDSDKKQRLLKMIGLM